MGRVGERVQCEDRIPGDIQINFLYYKPEDFQPAIDVTDRLREVQISLDSLRADFALATTEMARESTRRALIEQEQKQAELVQIRADKFDG